MGTNQQKADDAISMRAIDAKRKAGQRAADREIVIPRPTVLTDETPLRDAILVVKSDLTNLLNVVDWMLERLQRNGE